MLLSNLMIFALRAKAAPSFTIEDVAQIYSKVTTNQTTQNLDLMCLRLPLS